jgi:translation initiation factor IF-2
MSDNELFESKAEIEVVKPKKIKRRLTEKQLENLKKGREKMKAKRDELKKKKEEQDKKVMFKEEKKAVKANKKIVKEDKIRKKANSKKQEEALNHRELLLKKKLEKAEQEKDELRLQLQADRLSKFEDLKSKWLVQTETVEDYDRVSEELESIEEETILDDEKLGTTLEELMLKYKNA